MFYIQLLFLVIFTVLTTLTIGTWLFYANLFMAISNLILTASRYHFKEELQ